MEIYVKQIFEIEDKSLTKIAKWLYKWWGKEEGITLEGMKCYVKNCMQKDRLPQTYGLILNGEIIGIYMFIREDLTVRPDLYPWLGNVYIDKKYRGKGYSKVLLGSVEENLKKNTKEKVLYAYTTHQNLYENYNWKYLTDIDTYEVKDRIQRLMKLDIS